MSNISRANIKQAMIQVLDMLKPGESRQLSFFGAYAATALDVTVSMHNLAEMNELDMRVRETAFELINEGKLRIGKNLQYEKV